MQNKKRVWKHALIVLSIIVLSFATLIAIPYQANAIPGVSKAVSKVAQKAAKEVVTDKAVQLAMDIVFNYEMNDIMKNGYKVDEGYQASCLDKKETCSKPVQVKKSITGTDKKNIGKKVETILEQKSGATGWKKFLDWFVPIFLLGTAINWLTAQLDPDSEGLFDEIAKQALIDLGIIKPVPPVEDTGFTDGNGNPHQYPEDIPILDGSPSGTVLEDVIVDMQREFVFKETGKTNSIAGFKFAPISSRKAVIHVERVQSTNDILFVPKDIRLNMFYPNDWREEVVMSVNSDNKGFSIDMVFSGHTYYISQSAYYLEVYKNNQLLRQVTNYSGYYATNDIQMKDVKSLTLSPVYVTSVPNDNGSLYLNRLYYLTLNNGDKYKFKLRGTTNNNPTIPNYQSVTVIEQHANNNYSQLNYKIYVHGDGQIRDYPTYVPTIDVIELPTFPKDKPVKIIPPSVIPIKTPDGTPVEPDGNGGWKEVGTNKPIQVDEDTLIVEDPVETPEGDGYVNPDGSVLPKPQPDPTPEPSPPGTDLDQLGNNLPKELILALLDMLRSCLYFMVRLFKFLITIPLLDPIPIPNQALNWFFGAKFLGIQIMEVMRTLALTGLPFGIFKLVRKVF